MNKNYNIILQSGFDIELRSGDSGWNTAYLTKDGKRQSKSTYFRSNKQAASKINLKAVRAGSYCDEALDYFVKAIEKHKKSNVQN